MSVDVVLFSPNLKAVLKDCLQRGMLLIGGFSVFWLLAFLTLGQTFFTLKRDTDYRYDHHSPAFFTTNFCSQWSKSFG